jgi:hypothetical protein
MMSYTSDKEDEAREKIRQVFKIITEFMSDNHLKLNADKTVFIPITRKSKDFSPLVLDNNTLIRPSKEARNLGVFMQSNMSIDRHISHVRKTCQFHLRNIYQLKAVIPKEALPKVIYAYINSRYDFCNSLLSGATEKQIQKIQLIQNSCARILTNRPRTESITAQLRDLHWLPVKFRVKFKLLVMAHKVVYDEQYPAYIDLRCRNPTRTTRSSSYVQLVSSYSPRLKSVGGRSVTQQMIRTWNELPGSIRMEENLMKFRSLVKTYLFTQAFL